MPVKPHPRNGHFDHEGYCRCGGPCCVAEGGGECLCRLCACQSTPRTEVPLMNTTVYEGPYSGTHQAG